MSGLLVIPTLFAPVVPPGGTLWPASTAAVGPRGTLVAPPASGTGWTRSGSNIITTAADAVISGLDLSTYVLNLHHPGAVATDCKIRGGGIRNVFVWNTATACELNYCEVGGSGFTGIGPDFADSGTHAWTGDDLLLDHCHVFGDLENSINPGSGCIIQDSVLHRFGVGGADPHYDGVEMFGGEDSVTVARSVIFLTSDGSGTYAGSIDSWLPETGCINLYSNIDDFCMFDSIFGGGSSALNFDDANGSPGNTNVRIGKNRAGASHPCYYVRDSAGQVYRDDTNLTIAGWELYYAEDDATNATTFDHTLTVSAIGSP